MLYLVRNFFMTNSACIFCQIVAGTIPAFTVYEDDHHLAFLTIEPINAGHTLVIPKKHYEHFTHLPATENKDLFDVVQKVAKKIEAELQPKKVGLLIAGWDVPHTHIHVVPMNDYHDLTSAKSIQKTMPQVSKEEMQKIASKLYIL